MHAAAVDLRDWYENGPLAPFMRSYSLLGGSAGLLDAVQPAGDMSDPPIRQLALIRLASPGIHAQADFGAGRFEERSPVGAFMLVPPCTATQIQVFNPHHIQILAIEPAGVASALSDVGMINPDRPDFRHLHRGSFRSPHIDVLFRTLLAASDAEDDPSRLFVDSAVHRIVAILAGLAEEERRPDRGGLAPWQVRRALEALDALDARTLSLAELAALNGLSPFHFARAFTHSIGVPPHRYQIIRRMERAADMLTQGVLPLTDIGLALGYSSSQSFARVFRQHHGVSPSQYRHKHAACGSRVRGGFARHVMPRQ